MYAEAKKKNHRIRRLLAALLCAVMLLAALPGFERSASAASDGMVRVRLNTLSQGTSVSFRTTCAYCINGNPENPVAAGETFTVKLVDGALQLVCGDETRAMGASFSLTRSKGGIYGVKSVTPQTSNLLCGDLLFSVTGSTIQSVLRIYVEDYLYGVVAYEMSNSYPLEALKAQAVAARNYVLRQKGARASKSYDVGDGTNDQVFRGYVSTNTRVIQAVNETRGVVLYSGSSLAACFYAASNGGQTEATKNIWGSNLSYSIVKDDKYDLESGATSRTATINKDGTGLKAKLEAALIEGMAADLEAKGLSTDAADISIDGIVSITPHTPKYAAPSRLYKKLTFVMNVTGKNAAGASVSAQVSADVDTYGGLESWYSLSINSSSNEVVWVEETSGAFKVVFRRWGHGVGLSQRGAKVMAADYGMSVKEILEFYYPGTTYKTLSLTDTTGSTTNGSGGEIVDGGESSGGTEYEVIGTAKVVLSSDSSTLNLRAGASASSTSLAKIPNGATLNVYAVQDGWAAVDYNGTKGFVSAQYIEITYLPEESPEATVEPSATPDPDASYAQLVLTSGNTMYMRSGPSTATTAVTVLKHGAYLEVLGTEGEWSKVRTEDGLTGYVKTKYLVAVTVETTPTPGATAEPTPTPTPEPTATPAPEATESADVYAQVKLASASGMMNIRKGPSTSTGVVTVVKHGTYLQVLGSEGEWSHVKTQSGLTGYIKTKYLVIVQTEATPAPDATATPTPTAEPTATATPAPTAEPTATPTPAPTATPTPVPEEAMYAKVKLSSATGAMNIRKGPSTSTSVVTVVKHGAIVQLLETEGEWCRVKTQSGLTGYIKAKYLVAVAVETTPEPEATAEATATPTPAPTATPTPAPTETPEEDEEIYARVKLSSSAGAMNIRKSASTSSAVVTTVKHGSYVMVLEVGDEWCQVMTKSGKTGYIKTKYLVQVTKAEATGTTSSESDDTESSDGVVEANFAARTTANVNLRKKASTSSTSLGVLAKGTQVTVLAYNDTWTYVEYGSKNGYIMRKYLKAI